MTPKNLIRIVLLSITLNVTQASRFGINFKFPRLNTRNLEVLRFQIPIVDGCPQEICETLFGRAPSTLVAGADPCAAQELAHEIILAAKSNTEIHDKTRLQLIAAAKSLSDAGRKLFPHGCRQEKQNSHYLAPPKIRHDRYKRNLANPANASVVTTTQPSEIIAVSECNSSAPSLITPNTDPGNPQGITITSATQPAPNTPAPEGTSTAASGLAEEINVPDNGALGNSTITPNIDPQPNPAGTGIVPKNDGAVQPTNDPKVDPTPVPQSGSSTDSPNPGSSTNSSNPGSSTDSANPPSKDGKTDSPNGSNGSNITPLIPPSPPPNGKNSNPGGSQPLPKSGKGVIVDSRTKSSNGIQTDTFQETIVDTTVSVEPFQQIIISTKRLGRCQNPKISVSRKAQKDIWFAPVDQVNFKLASSQSLDEITRGICSRFSRNCGVRNSDNVTSICRQLSRRIGPCPSDPSGADKWNLAFGFQTTFSTDQIPVSPPTSGSTITPKNNTPPLPTNQKTGTKNNGQRIPDQNPPTTAVVERIDVFPNSPAISPTPSSTTTGSTTAIVEQIDVVPNSPATSPTSSSTTTGSERVFISTNRLGKCPNTQVSVNRKAQKDIWFVPADQVNFKLASSQSLKEITQGICTRLSSNCGLIKTDDFLVQCRELSQKVGTCFGDPSGADKWNLAFGFQTTFSSVNNPIGRQNTSVNLPQNPKNTGSTIQPPNNARPVLPKNPQNTSPISDVPNIPKIDQKNLSSNPGQINVPGIPRLPTGATTLTKDTTTTTTTQLISIPRATLGNCSNTQISATLSAQKEIWFVPVDQSNFKLDSSKNLKDVTQGICLRLSKSCGLKDNINIQKQCQQLSQSIGTSIRKSSGADTWNSCFGFKTTYSTLETEIIAKNVPPKNNTGQNRVKEADERAATEAKKKAEREREVLIQKFNQTENRLKSEEKAEVEKLTKEEKIIKEKVKKLEKNGIDKLTAEEKIELEKLKKEEKVVVDRLKKEEKLVVVKVKKEDKTVVDKLKKGERYVEDKLKKEEERARRLTSKGSDISISKKDLGKCSNPQVSATRNVKDLLFAPVDKVKFQIPASKNMSQITQGICSILSKSCGLKKSDKAISQCNELSKAIGDSVNDPKGADKWNLAFGFKTNFEDSCKEKKN